MKKAKNAKHITAVAGRPLPPDLRQALNQKVEQEIGEVELEVLVDKRVKEGVELQLQGGEVLFLRIVVVTTARPLGSKLEQKLEKKLETKLEEKVLLNWQEDEDLIGGLKLEIGSKVINASIAHQIKNITAGKFK